MKLSVKFEGQNDPFEGNRILRLKRLPVGAQVTMAQVTVKPKQAVETVTFNNGIGNWGATKEPVELDNWVAVDFHARRMVSRVTAFANPAADVTVQVDIGGLWVRLLEDGTIATPDTEDDELLSLSLTSLANTQTIPPLVVQRLKLTQTTGIGTVGLTQLTVLSHPTNLNLRLGQMPPFWTRPGEMIRTETSTDFAAVLQNFLTEAEVVDGFYEVPLVVHSDSIARLDVEVEIEYLNQQTVLPEGVPEATLAFDHSSLPKTEANLLQIEVPMGARVVPGETTARVIGVFEESRVVYGPTGEVTPAATVPVSSGQSQAQPLMFPTALAATAIDLLLAVDKESRFATLNLVLLGDTDGKPSNESLLPKPVTLTLDRDVAAKPTWVSAALPLEFQFRANERYWLTLQARDEGKVNWSVEPGPADRAGLQFTADGGLSWRASKAAGVAAPLGGFFRLRHTPSRYRVPIELQVGLGDQARRVSLQRFQPLGRVDFSLDFDEVAEAINQYLGEAAKVQCSEEEHLFNGDFREWVSVGDSLMPPRLTPVEMNPRVVATAPDGQSIYLGGWSSANQSSMLQFLDPDCYTLIGAVGLPEEPIDIVVHPNNSRAYIATLDGSDYELVVIDLVSRQVIGDPVLLGSGFSNLVLSLDGRRLYLTDFEGYPDGAIVQSIDTQALEQALLDGTANINTLTAGRIIRLEVNLRPEAIALAPDGEQLYVFVGSINDGEIHIVNAIAQTYERLLAELNITPREIALTPDGKYAVVTGTHSEENDTFGDIYIVDTANGTFEIITATDRSPGAIAISPDGRRAFVIDNEQRGIQVVDIARHIVVDFIDIGFRLENISLSARGDRIYTLGAQPNYPESDQFFLVSIPLGIELPSEWALTSGSIMPFCFADPYHRVAVLGFAPLTNRIESSSTALSQVIPITESCNYELSFWGSASTLDAVVEVIWLGDTCGFLRTDQVAIEPFESSEAWRPDEWISAMEPDQPLPELILHRTRLMAPEGAVQAEVRVNVPADTVAIIDQISLKGSREAVANNDLNFVHEDQLADWGLSAAAAARVSLTPGDEGMQIQNLGLESVTLTQTISVVANQPFVLEFRGRVATQSPRSVNPKVELHWLDINGATIEPVTTLTISSTGTGPYLLRGRVPAEASEADLQLLIPGQTTLVVKQVSFQPVELIQVPLTFIAQAPGELTISDFRVAYDVAEASPPPIPAGGLCAPTPPGRTPGSQPGGRCFCPCCGGEKQMEHPEPTALTAGRPAVRGQCPDCGTELVQPGGRASSPRSSLQPVPARRPAIHFRVATAGGPTARPADRRLPAPVRPPAIMPMEAEIAAMLPMSEAEWAALADPLAAEVPIPPLTEIKGIGEGRSRQLTSIGIDSLAQLAKAAPEDIARTLMGVSVEQAAGFIQEAQRQIEAVPTRQAPRVSCVMITYNRRHFVPQAIEYFLRQDYPNRELIIVDDGTDPIRDLVPDNPQIHYIQLTERITLGAKRNLACQEANGRFIVHWDDDDWIDDWRVSYEIASLLKSGADICGLNNLLYYDIVSQKAWHYVLPQEAQPWVAGSTLCYAKSFWQQNPFPDIDLGQSVRFVRQNPSAKLLPLQAITFQVNMIHPANTSSKNVRARSWHPYPVEEIQKLLGEDWTFYVHLFQENKQRR